MQVAVAACIHAYGMQHVKFASKSGRKARLAYGRCRKVIFDCAC